MRSEQHRGHDQGHDPRPRPSLTVTEAAQQCGVSATTIRRYLAAGRFPTAQQRPSPVPGQRPQWRIPTDDLLRAGLRPHQAGSPQHDQADARDRIRELEHALEVERIRRQAAEDLAAERAEMLQTLERALRALQARRAGPTDPETAPAPPAWSPSAAGSPPDAEPAPQPGMLPMVPRRRPPKRELSQEERAAIIGRALSRQPPPPRRRWLWR
jgi:hypothetical protein